MNTFINKSIFLIFVITTAISAHAGFNIINTNIVDVGKIYNTYTSKNEFGFVNNGDKDVKIMRLISTCTCIKGSNSVDIVKPGESCKVETYFNASSVHGKFSRGVWVFTNDPENKKTLLKINGEVLPLFTGIPEDEMTFQASDEKVVFTNKFTITGTTTDYTIGTPTSFPSNSIAFDCKKEEFANSNVWHLTTYITPSSEVRQSIVAQIPVVGPIKLGDLKLKFKLIVGAPLKASPTKLVVTSKDKGFSKSVYISTYSTQIAPELLKCEPKIDGLEAKASVYKRKSRSTSNLLSGFGTNAKKRKSKVKRASYTRYICSFSVTKEALVKLLAMDKPGVTLSYPHHKSVFVEMGTLIPKAPPQGEKK